MVVWQEGRTMNYSLGSSLSKGSLLRLKGIELDVKRREVYRLAKRVVRVPVKREIELVHV